MKNLLLSLCLLLFTACGDKPAKKEDISENIDTTPVHGDVYVYASLGKATNLVPWLAGESAATEIAQHVYSTVLKYDKNLSLTGELAEKWEVSPDNLSITFHLRQDVNWHDGKPVTTRDIKATFDKLIDPNTRTPYAGDYLLVDKFDVIDSYTFRVTYNEPFSPALASWAGFTVLPAHIIENEPDFNETTLKHTPLGNGPYQISHRDADVATAFTANKTYFGGEPYITGRRIRVIADQDAQFLELKTGNIDAMGLTPVQFTRLTNKSDFTARYAKYKYLSNGYTYLGFKLNHPIFSDKRVRQALSYATPRQQIIKGILFGQGEPIAGPFKPGTWANNEALEPIPYNQEKAKQLLTETGWADTDGNGILDKNINGKQTNLAFTVVTNQGNAQRIKTAEILQQFWKEIGVDMKIQVQEWSTFIENTINARNFDAFILGWSLTPEPDPYDIWHSSKTGEKEFNIIGFNNPEADDLMTKARRTFDQTERKKYLDRFQEILHDEQPYLFLYAPYSLVALHKRIHNIDPAPAGLNHNFDKWYVPQALQVRTP